MHANGRVSLNRNPERTQNFVAQYGGMIRIEADRLVLEEKFLSCFQDAVEELIGSVGSA